MSYNHNTQKAAVLDSTTGKIYSLFVIKRPPWHHKSKHNGVPQEILAWFCPIFPPVTNISLNISIQFPPACEVHLLWSDCFTSPKHHNGNNDMNDPTNEWRSYCCISILLLQRKLGDFKGDLHAFWSSGFPNAHIRRGSHRSTLWNTWLSCLLILEERYSQCCASACASKPFRGRPLSTDSHYWYTSHIHLPTRSTADTRKSTRTYTPQAIKDMQCIEMCL